MYIVVYQERRQGMNEVMTIKETACILGVSVLQIREGIKQGLYPFGVAVKANKRHHITIYRRRFYKWLEGNL